MSINRSNSNLAYGFNNALQTLYPADIFAKRAPLSSDIAELGTFWIYNDQVYKLTSSKTWTQLATDSGDGAFASLAVTADVTLGSDATGDISLVAAHINHTGSTTFTNNSLVGSVKLLVPANVTTGSSTTLTLNNSNITTTSQIILTIATNNVSATAATVGIKGINLSSGVATLYIINNGTGTLTAGTDYLNISFIILG